jgi:hypothetical protein
MSCKKLQCENYLWLREMVGPAERTPQQKRNEGQNNTSQNMKIGNGADTREFTRAVQVETYRKCAKSTNTQFEKLAYRHS